MTALSTLAAARSSSAAHRAAWLGAGLAMAALGRAALNGTGSLTAYLAGSAFALMLLALAVAAGWRPSRPGWRGLVIGALGGVILVGLPMLSGPPTRATIGIRPEPLLPWLLVTAAVVSAEEVLLRGAFMTALDEAAGPPIAVLGSSVAFALMHVPLYGWAVVPVDLAAGVWLAGLRYLSGGVAASTVAHLLADSATGWLR